MKKITKKNRQKNEWWLFVGGLVGWLDVVRFRLLGEWGDALMLTYMNEKIKTLNVNTSRIKNMYILVYGDMEKSS